jgi:hypothetical protein
VLYCRLSENFLATHGLQYKPEMLQFEAESRNLSFEPLAKPNYAAMAKQAQIEKGVLQTVLSNIFHVVGELLAENKIVEVDLGDLGKLFANDR